MVTVAMQRRSVLLALLLVQTGLAQAEETQACESKVQDTVSLMQLKGSVNRRSTPPNDIPEDLDDVAELDEGVATSDSETDVKLPTNITLVLGGLPGASTSGAAMQTAPAPTAPKIVLPTATASTSGSAMQTAPAPTLTQNVLPTATLGTRGPDTSSGGLKTVAPLPTASPAVLPTATVADPNAQKNITITLNMSNFGQPTASGGLTPALAPAAPPAPGTIMGGVYPVAPPAPAVPVTGGLTPVAPPTPVAAAEPFVGGPGTYPVIPSVPTAPPAPLVPILPVAPALTPVSPTAVAPVAAVAPAVVGGAAGVAPALAPAATAAAAVAPAVVAPTVVGGPAGVAPVAIDPTQPLTPQLAAAGGGPVSDVQRIAASATLPTGLPTGTTPKPATQLGANAKVVQAGIQQVVEQAASTGISAGFYAGVKLGIQNLGLNPAKDDDTSTGGAAVAAVTAATMSTTKAPAATTAAPAR